MSAEQYYYSECHLEEARSVCGVLDRERAAGIVDEYAIIAQAICDAERRATFPLRKKIAALESELAKLRTQAGTGPCRRARLKDRRALILKLKSEGYSYREIANRVGLKSPSRIHKIIHGAPHER